MERSDAGTDERPLYSQRRKQFLRAVVLIAVGAMMLPILASLFSVNSGAAQFACATAVRIEAPDATGSTAKFEFFGPGGIGWECYAIGGFGGTKHIASLGIIPNLVTNPGGVRV